MNYVSSRDALLRRAAAGFAAAVLTLWMVVVSAHSFDHHRLALLDTHAGHGAHALVASLGSEFFVDTGHTHIEKGSASTHHEQYLVAVLPSAPSIVAGLAVAVAVAAVAVLLGLRALRGARGPPVVTGGWVAGQDLLMRMCLLRR